jgi:hypothetical protein
MNNKYYNKYYIVLCIIKEMDYININEDNEPYFDMLLIIIIGITIGLCIGYFFMKKTKYIGPDSNKIVKEIYTDRNGKKYKYIPKITICPLSYSMNKLHDNNFKSKH